MKPTLWHDLVCFLFDSDPDGWAASYVDLMIITDECMKRSMHLWSVNNQITYSICSFWGRSWMSSSVCHSNAKKLSKTAFHMPCPFSKRPLSVPIQSFYWPIAHVVLPEPQRQVKRSYRKELWRTLTVAVLCLRVSVSVFMLNTLWRRPTLGQAQLKMILHSSEEILETLSRTIQEALEERLLIRLETARYAILIDAAAAICQTAFANVLSGAGSIDVAAAVNQQVFSLTDITKFICEQCLALDGVSALSDLSTAVAQVEADFPRDAMVWISYF